MGGSVGGKEGGVWVSDGGKEVWVGVLVGGKEGGREGVGVSMGEKEGVCLCCKVCLFMHCFTGALSVVVLAP